MTDILTVADLIAQLSKHPLDAPVIMMDTDEYETAVNVCTESDSDYVVISAGLPIRRSK